MPAKWAIEKERRGERRVLAFVFGKAESTRRIPSYHRFSHGFVTDNFPADIFLQSSVISRILSDTFQLVLSQTTDKCIKLESM